MNVSSTKRQRADIDMRAFARSAGATIKVPAGGGVFSKGEAGDCMYIVQAGVIDMVIGDKVIETIGANEALGFMSMIDDKPRSSTARGARGVRTVADRSAHIPLHGGRSAELRDLHHGRAGAAHPRHEPGDVRIIRAVRAPCQAAVRRYARRSHPMW
jgi:hypothetical protein